MVRNFHPVNGLLGLYLAKKIAVTRIAIFASGAGSNAANIIRYFHPSESVRVVLVATNNPHAGVLQIAREWEVESLVFDRSSFLQEETFLKELTCRKVDYVILAGFLWKVPEYLIRAFPNHIINIHPSLLPKFGGKGMYGHHVHEAVHKAEEKESGITIHYVNEHYDEGKIIFQARFDIEAGDGPEGIERKVRHLEMKHFPEVLDSVFRQQQTVS
jgi:phosphoribosylglycinamide formyltransferase-1